MSVFPKQFPVTSHTDFVGPGSTFVAIKGMTTDGVQFIPQAVAAGATRVVIDQSVVLSQAVEQLIDQQRIVVERVDNTRKALAVLSAQAAGYPTKQLTMVGITGTKGKTSSAFLIYHLLRAAGFATALISTVKNSVNGIDMPPVLTTPQPDYLHQFFSYARTCGVTHVVMEVAAQAITMHRIEGIMFDALLFTNFSMEHLEFYPSMEAYGAAKAALVAYRKPNAIVLCNGDDAWCASLPITDRMTFGTGSNDWRIETDDAREGLVAVVREQDRSVLVTCPALFGPFNAMNVLGAYAVARSMGVSVECCVEALKTFESVPGRLERHALSNGAVAYVDYAHNPASYELVLSTLKQKTDHLIVVFGCGGDRDVKKRPLMGAVAQLFADQIILTSDNPRHERLSDIILDIERGITQKEKIKVVPDRAQAIQVAYAQSRRGSIIAILGKGPESYEIVGDAKIPYSDAQVVRALR